MKNLTLPIKEIQHSAGIIENQNIVGRVLNTLLMELHLEVFPDRKKLIDFWNKNGRLSEIISIFKRNYCENLISCAKYPTTIPKYTQYPQIYPSANQRARSTVSANECARRYQRLDFAKPGHTCFHGFV